MSDFGHAIKLQVNGYTGTETLTNFPVLVRVSETRIPGFQYAHLSNSMGADIAFFDELGNHLASEIETNSWKVGTAKDSQIWVRLSQMTQGTKFYMCYNTSASHAMVTNANPWTDYVGVWHLDESGNQSNNKFVCDATTNALNGKIYGTSDKVSRYSDGKVGAARRIAVDRNHDYAILVNATNGTQKVAADSLGTDFTASFWMNPQGSKVADFNYGFLIDRRKGEYNDPGGWGVRFHDGSSGKQQLQVYAADELIPGLPNNDKYNGTMTASQYPSLYTIGTWSKVDIRWYATSETAGAADIYVNGVFVETVTLPKAPKQEGATNIGIGCSTADTPANNTKGKGRRFNGYMDEVRLRAGGRSADWIKADYDTVVNTGFVMLAPPVVAWTNASGATPGVASFHKDHVTFAGTVTDCGGFANCAIQCKIWATGGTEPESWTTLTNELVTADAFSVSFPGLMAETSYSYKLRAAGNSEIASETVESVFTTPAGLSIAWSSATAATGLSEIGHDHVVIGGVVESAVSTCGIKYMIWTESEPETWTPLTNGLVKTDVFEVAVTGLTPSTTYHYALSAFEDGDELAPVIGTFETKPPLTISTEVSNVSYGFAIVGGTVTALGGATKCDVEYKVWTGASELGWTLLAENLGLNDGFSVSITNLDAGTTYNYKFHAVGDDGEEFLASGTFTTKGEEGEVIGSEYTKFFDDGTNACWVVDGFERYLPFTVTGYTGTETLTNFPVLVDIRNADTNGFTYADFYHYDGSDMAFVDEKGHIIPHEIDTWNKNGMSLIWVRLPEMVNGTKFTMCYRSPLLTPLPDVGNTFEKYVGVWHMNETQDGVVSIKDSTANNLSGESHARSLAGINQGQMIGGNARRVAQETGTSSSNGRIMVYDHDDILRTSVSNVFTYSGWYKVEGTNPGWAYLVARKGDDYSKGWGIQYTDTKDNLDRKNLRVWSDPEGNKGLHVDGKAGGYYHFNIQTYSTGAATGYAHDSWSYWTFVFSNNTFHAFHNGIELASTAGGFTLAKPFANDETAAYDYLVIGGQEFGSGALNGWVDEARYSKGVRSDDWIKAEYDSTRQKDIAFVTKGTVSIGNDSPVPVIVWEKGVGLPVSIIDVSYAYVQFAGMVTYCGKGADECRIEYQIWADGEEDPTIDGIWMPLGNLTNATAGTSFSIPVTGLKQDMPYNFRIRAVNTLESGEEQANREQSGSFRTLGNLAGSDEGELLRIDNRFVHRYRAGSYTFTTPDYVTSVEILVVGGGGAGGYKIGGGGGGGGLFYSESFPVETNTTYRIQVGTGGDAASGLGARGENGQLSYFARLDVENGVTNEIMLVRVPGGGAGGSYVNNAAIAKGDDGGSGGGGSFALAGGQPVSNAVDGVWVTYGYEGGPGNDSRMGGNQLGKTAAGGGGGAAREGVTASFDSWYGGGAGGAGLANSMTGEELFYGAGGGGGYAYRTDDTAVNYSKPGAGGSGIGGNAADIRNGTPATSGVENTGAGGGGGSMILNNQTDQTYWQGGDGGDGVVLIAYEVHGRDPIAEEPRISMTRCAYDPDAGTTGTGVATIDYRAFWAGIQAQEDDIYVLYSTVSEEDVAAENGDRVKVSENAIGTGTTTFVPPEVGYTYWIRLMSRKDESSFMYTDEIASFYVPAVTLNGVAWKKQNSASDDYATIDYKLHDLNEATHLYCYWSESRESLEGDARPSGNGVRMLDVGAGKAALTTFNLPASEGLKRNKVYYIRLAAGDEQGVKHFLSDDILELSTTEQPAINFLGASWAAHVATLTIKTAISTLAPSNAEVFVFYSTNKTDLTSGSPWENGASRLVLGTGETIPDNVDTIVSFPLSSTVATTYYVRVAIRSIVESKLYYSGTTREFSVTAFPANTLIIYANANPKMGCYGDEPQTLDYTVTYGGLTEGPGWDNYTNTSMHVVGEQSCEVTAASNVGQYDIEQGTLALSNNGASYRHPVTDVEYFYLLSYAGAKYAVTNAVFSAVFDDAEFTYDGESHAGASPTVTGIRNNRTVSYQYRVGSGEWGAAPSFTDAGNYTVQFKASAQNHTGNNGTFTVTINPAPLSATISAEDLNYLGKPQIPSVTTNVTGHIRPGLNPLTCEFRDEAGEWITNAVPSFTQPGTYKLFFRVSAPNHTTFTTNCTFTIVGWDYMVNMDGQTGYATSIRVTDPGWFLRTTGLGGDSFSESAARYAKLDETCENGLKLWQNYVIERNDLSEKLVATIHQNCQRVAPNCFELRFPDVSALRNTGLDVKFRVDRKLKEESEFTQGTLTDKYEVNVPLGPHDPTGLYVFNIVLTNGTGQAVMASCATVGVMRVSSPLPNTVVAVPWRSMAHATTNKVNVAAGDAVNPNGITTGDMILSYNQATTNFNAWSIGSDGSWNGLATVNKGGVSIASPTNTFFALGSAFWLVRSEPTTGGATNCFYLIGRYTGESYEVPLAGGTVESPGNTLVANPTTADIALNDNDLVFDGDIAPDDKIMIQNAAGAQTIYYRGESNSKWGCNVLKKEGRRMKNVWTPGGTVPSGTGFWYLRTSEDPLSIRFNNSFGGAE